MRSFAFLPAIILALVVQTSFAADRFIPIAGTVNNFRTDTRIFNPSRDRELVLAAFFLPAGNVANSTHLDLGDGHFIVIPPRQMRVVDDIVKSVFDISSQIGGIVLSCRTPLPGCDNGPAFEVTSRIYAQTPNGTLGQSVPALTIADAKRNGVLLQLKSTSAFRTNIGALNPVDVTARITWKLYDRNNAVVATREETMPPFAVIAPVNVAGYFSAQSADLSEAWVSFEADSPIMAYASLVDNSTTDPTFINAQDDVRPATQTQTYHVSLSSWQIDFSSPVEVRRGDTVHLRVHSEFGGHGFSLTGPDGSVLVPERFYDAGDSAEFTFVASQNGTYRYFCTATSCGGPAFSLHDSMSGEFVVGSSGSLSSADAENRAVRAPSPHAPHRRPSRKHEHVPR